MKPRETGRDRQRARLESKMRADHERLKHLPPLAASRQVLRRRARKAKKADLRGQRNTAAAAELIVWRSTCRAPSGRAVPPHGSGS